MNSHRYMDTDVAIYRPMREKPNKKCRQYFACCACQVTHAKKLAQDINNLNCHIGHMSTTYLSASGIQLWGGAQSLLRAPKTFVLALTFHVQIHRTHTPAVTHDLHTHST